MGMGWSVFGVQQMAPNPQKMRVATMTTTLAYSTVLFVFGFESVKQFWSTKMEPLPASFYGNMYKRNPVISAFDGDIKNVMSLMKRISTLPTYDHNSYARGAKTLFEIWNKYKPRLPTNYYEEHMLQMNTPHTMGLPFMLYFCDCLYPPPLCVSYLCPCDLCGSQPTQKGVQRLLSILGFVRIMMQAVLPHEHLCWLLYNGSLYIYNICRYLMSMSRAEEFLLWACICLETSIPLMTARFLEWRATLYCAVCQCYYDSQANVQAEVFARRALGKVSELGKLEEMSGLPATTETQRAYKVATIKLATMVFKRSVYEPRRKPKGLFRHKQKSNLKEIQSMPWPRTPTERVLMELFEGNAAQFLAIVEALWDTSRRPLQTGMPEEPEIQEVSLELMSAGISILADVVERTILLCFVPPGENKVSLDAAVKFVKLLFRYEQWDMFCILSDTLQHTLLPVSHNTPLLGLVSYNYVVSVSYTDVQPDGDLVMDIVLYLWSKCKIIFQRAQVRHWDPIHFLGKMENLDKVQ
uniref:Cilia and flagella associated protein 54 n=1 Tax=Salmo trutta TaxID=8032 RepID=A0A673X1P8_SALTR